MRTWLAKLARRFSGNTRGQRGREPRRWRAPLSVPLVELLENRLAPTVSASISGSTITFTGHAADDSLLVNETGGGKLTYDLAYGLGGLSDHVVTTALVCNSSLNVIVHLPGSTSTLTLGNRWSFNEQLTYDSGISGNNNNILVGPTPVSSLPQSNSWVLTGYAAGQINFDKVLFANVGTVQGGGNDEDRLKGETVGGTFSVDISSGTPVDTYNDGSGNPAITFANMGTLVAGDDTSNRTNTFTLTGNNSDPRPVFNLVGGHGINVFQIDGTIDLSGVNIDGGACDDTGFGSATLDYSNADPTNLVTIQLQQEDTSEGHGYDGTQTDAGGLASFLAIDQLIGHASADGLIGLNDSSSTWAVNTESTYSTTDSSLTFSGFTFLQGGSLGNTFNIDGSTSDVITGGAASDTLNFGAYGAVSVTLTGSDIETFPTPSYGFSGTATGIASFANIDDIVGHAGSTLTGEVVANSTWALGSANSYSDGNATLAFSTFATVSDACTTLGTFTIGAGTDVTSASGNANANEFDVNGSNSSLTLHGGAGPDTLSYAGYGAAVVTLGASTSAGFSSSSASGLAAFSGIDTLTGHAGSTLHGAAATDSTWILGGTNSYSDGSHSLTFSAFATLSDASSTLGTFTIGGGTDVTSATGNATANEFDVNGTNSSLTLHGGAGPDTLSYAGYGAAVVTLGSSDGTGFSSSSASGLAAFSGIDTLAGHAGST
ncbi:MAG TPA: hypothetical protein VKA46_05915, partial [Gemmataceae bacterium]|nr:hypothetical protein [Gemmataceae bacterium]